MPPAVVGEARETAMHESFDLHPKAIEGVVVMVVGAAYM